MPTRPATRTSFCRTCSTGSIRLFSRAIGLSRRRRPSTCGRTLCWRSNRLPRCCRFGWWWPSSTRRRGSPSRTGLYRLAFTFIPDHLAAALATVLTLVVTWMWTLGGNDPRLRHPGPPNSLPGHLVLPALRFFSRTALDSGRRAARRGFADAASRQLAHGGRTRRRFAYSTCLVPRGAGKPSRRCSASPAHSFSAPRRC